MNTNMYACGIILLIFVYVCKRVWFKEIRQTLVEIEHKGEMCNGIEW